MVITGYLISPENYEINFKLKEFLILLIIAVCLIPIQTSVEEIVFRGYLMQGLAIGSIVDLWLYLCLV